MPPLSSGHLFPHQLPFFSSKVSEQARHGFIQVLCAAVFAYRTDKLLQKQEETTAASNLAISQCSREKHPAFGAAHHLPLTGKQKTQIKQDARLLSASTLTPAVPGLKGALVNPQLKEHPSPRWLWGWSHRRRCWERTPGELGREDSSARRETSRSRRKALTEASRRSEGNQEARGVARDKRTDLLPQQLPPKST